MNLSRAIASSGLCALLAGCATAGAADDDAGGEAADGGRTADAARSDGGAGCPTGKTGPSCSQCAGGFHACPGSTCAADHPNQPDAGCTSGCGSPCAAPANATAKCSPQGQCDFDCNATWDKADAGCACQAGLIDCNDGTCAACCSSADCPQHQTCAGGTCGGCDDGWADCNNSSGDGCETSLASEPNCGACGRSCSGYPACGLFTFHGESCKPSGQSFGCKC